MKNRFALSAVEWWEVFTHVKSGSLRCAAWPMMNIAAATDCSIIYIHLYTKIYTAAASVLGCRMGWWFNSSHFFQPIISPYTEYIFFLYIVSLSPPPNNLSVYMLHQNLYVWKKTSFDASYHTKTGILRGVAESINYMNNTTCFGKSLLKL